MMTREEHMNVTALHAAGWTIRQIAQHLDYHPATVSGWLKAGGPPPRRKAREEEAVVDPRWQERIAPHCWPATPSCRPRRSCG